MNITSVVKMWFSPVDKKAKEKKQKEENQFAIYVVHCDAFFCFIAAAFFGVVLVKQ